MNGLTSKQVLARVILLAIVVAFIITLLIVLYAIHGWVAVLGFTATMAVFVVIVWAVNNL